MLLRCLKIIRVAIKRLNPKTIGSLAFPKSQALKGNATAATMEANETKRKRRKIAIHISNQSGGEIDHSARFTI